MPIDIIASRPHYLDHLLPVWLALPEERRGRLHAPGSRGVLAIAAQHGIAADAHYPDRSNDPVLCAGGNDLAYSRGRPVVLLEHGAGQTYTELDDPAHAGGRDREGVALFCHPREETALRDRQRYPGSQVEVVGCPRLDAWHQKSLREISEESATMRGVPDLRALEDEVEPVVGVTFHWPADSVGIPEARWAFPHYGRAGLELLAARYTVVGHGHPRAIGWLRAEYHAANIDFEPDLDRFFGRVDVLCADNTSALPEYASARDRPLVFLNAPWYRRDWSHGCRFWDWPRGQVSVDDPAGLVDGVTEALLDDGRRAEARRAMTRSVYAFDDGLAAARVAGFMLDRWP